VSALPPLYGFWRLKSIGVNLAGILGDAEADPEGGRRGVSPAGEGSGEEDRPPP